ncbi:MAG: hypothetical protein IPL55_00370 [Saprospiraceae bacterium]|nr:hypothetical protein [Saprospiraceae bacterium]
MIENMMDGTPISQYKQIDPGNSILEVFIRSDKKYGGYYRFSEVYSLSLTPGKISGICPQGWRLPLESEIQGLILFYKDNIDKLISDLSFWILPDIIILL